MDVTHIAVRSSSEEKADRFYQGLLGLRKTRSVVIPSDLANSVLGVNREIKKVDYGSETMTFEVFLTDRIAHSDRGIDHVGLGVKAMVPFLDRCRGMGVEVLKFPRGGKVVFFIRDFDGNLFEIKEKG